MAAYGVGGGAEGLGRGVTSSRLALFPPDDLRMRSAAPRAPSGAAMAAAAALAFLVTRGGGLPRGEGAEPGLAPPRLPGGSEGLRVGVGSGPSGRAVHGAPVPFRV